MYHVAQRIAVRARRKRKRLPNYRSTQFVRVQGEHVTREFIIKIHGWCNLACTYCYMYESKDQSWREKPSRMTPRIALQLAWRLGEYVREHNLGNLNIVLHGGEPLLAGVRFIRLLVNAIRAAVPTGCVLRFRMQTNGTMMSQKTAYQLAKLGITVGVSLDGDESANKERILRSGRPSYAATMKGIGILAKFDQRQRRMKKRRIFERTLCVVNLNNSPEVTIRTLFNTGAAAADLLLPLKNHDDVDPLQVRFSEATPYADWLIRAFWEWVRILEENPKAKFRIRFFNQIMQLARYKAYGWEFPWNIGIEVIGPYVVGALVIETDGSVELLDGRKTVRPGEAFTGLRIHHDSLTKALVTMLDISDTEKITSPPKACLPCPLLDICGGGYYLHRWSSANGYDNPSWYCADLIKLITFLVNFAWPVFKDSPHRDKSKPLVYPLS